ncbi:helix-turn-helix transcriptional regulator [Lentzea sp. HUAS12]|uniref:helix-turn-helix transcriptional regulator n=1 Tax=Lentzea sp. HUAS12 TaxID=2951806 RepID=UPI00209F460A|nr:LuxR family transcriptional regulator [Lentzea sp. HUAS12]USX54886.1 AAA family ATPase [Lentzea sp. HUAS12]
MLIGRDSERQRIERLVASARIGHGGALAITGEPGVGKTALLGFAAESAAGMNVLRAAGIESEKEIPFGALHQVLRPALDRLGEIPGPQAQALSVALALRPGPAIDRFAVGAATLSLLCRFAEERPVAVLLDDLHLVDGSSADALAFAARRLVADPVVLLATTRSPDPPLPSLALTGIDLAAADELVSSRSDVPVSPELIARLHRATAGNPLALIELAGSRLEHLSPEAPLPVSAELARAFASQARSLGAGGRAALAVASVAGTDLRVVVSACRVLGVAVDALAEAESAGLVRIAGGRVEFRHPLIRAAVYGDTDPRRRRVIHRAVAEAVGPHDADRHAWHRAESVVGPDAQVADLLVQAARRAHERSAHDVAAAAFERAARLSPDVSRHASLCVAAAESAWLAGETRRSVSLLDEVGGGAGAVELRAAIAARTGSLTEARDLCRIAARESADADSAVVLLADAVHACFYLGDTRSGVELAHEIEALLDGVVTPKAQGLGQMAVGVARILANRGGADQIRAGVGLLASTGLLRDDRRRLSWLMIGPLFLRDADSGEELRRVVADARAETAVGTLPALLFHVARDEATTNQWVRAEATYDEATRLARETGQETDLAMCLAGLAWLRARLGDEERCRALVAEALPICRARDIHIGRVWSLFALGELELGLGDPLKALAHLEELAALLDDLRLTDPDLSPAPELTDAMVRLGRRDDAWDVARRYRAEAAAKGQPWALGRAERTLGMLSEDGFDTHFEASLRHHARTLDDFETARTRLAYGARLRRARRRVDARPHLHAALETFENLRAARWADLAAVELGATGETIKRRTQGETLTPQELQVSLLLAEGKTTREVAAALFLSPKTIEYHLRKVYTKLGIRSRAELADRLP